MKIRDKTVHVGDIIKTVSIDHTVVVADVSEDFEGLEPAFLEHIGRVVALTPEVVKLISGGALDTGDGIAWGVSSFSLVPRACIMTVKVLERGRKQRRSGS